MKTYVKISDDRVVDLLDRLADVLQGTDKRVVFVALISLVMDLPSQSPLDDTAKAHVLSATAKIIRGDVEAFTDLLGIFQIPFEVLSEAPSSVKPS